jgi:integrase
MATRRGNSEGTITKRADGRWEARITLEEGKRKCYYGKTRQEVAQRLTAALRDRENGLPIIGEKQTVEEYLTSWLDVTQHTIRPRTWKRYSELIRLHALPTLGKIRLAKLTPQQIQTLYSQKLSEGLSSTTVHHLHARLHRAFDRAVRLGLVQRNICDLVDAPRMKHQEMVTLSEEEARTLLAAAKGERLEALYVLAVATGMRQGELLALRWRDVDLGGATVQVRATLHWINGEYVFAEPKTEFSRRRVALAKGAVTALEEHRTRQIQEREAARTAWEDLELVFPNTVGRPIDGINLLKYWFFPLLKKAGLPRMRFHDLRHSAATLLLGRGINPKVVSEMLGHSHVSITLGIYSHVTPHMQEQAAMAMDAALGFLQR